jgi:non-lysosomal glucosylceramidase
MKKTDGIRSFASSASEVAFPLGGVGTGNVSLGARGDLRDWEIFNSPAKGNNLPNTFFAIRTQSDDSNPLTRIIEGPIQQPHIRSHGYHPSTTAGLPRFANSKLHGEYPLVTVDFEDEKLPISVQLEAYTPLIPLNAEDSGIPATILTYTVTNTSTTTQNITLVGSIVNPVGGLEHDPYGGLRPSRRGAPINEYRDNNGLRGLYLRSNDDIVTDDLDFGNMSLVTDHDNVSYKRAWLRGAWFDNLREFWDDLVEDGQLNDLDYDAVPSDGKPDTGSLALLDTLQAGETRSYRFMLTWYFPNRVNNWKSSAFNFKQDTDTASIIRNHYATRFDDAWHVADYIETEFNRLDQATRTFHEALFSSTFPPVVLDALSANIVPIRSTTCFWLEDGRFYGWEGCFDDEGCCPGSCTHVWSYAQTSAFLFPSLERAMREIEFEIETEDDGYMTFRTFKTFGGEFVWQWAEQRPEAAVDGQMGCILRAYREWQLCGDTEWLRRLWNPIKQSIAFAQTQWDKDNDNVLDGRQHNTYDIEFFGPNPLSSIYYLAGLRAVEEMAKVMDDLTIAANCRKAFESGSKNLDDMLWNGEFYIQQLDDVDAYHYQHGLGCLSDQLLGQLHARILGLGDLLPKAHIESAIHSIYKYNFRTNFQDHVNAQRTYVLNDESGLLLCSWPDGGEPKFPFVYSDEVWTGIEYQVAAHLIYEGYTEEGLNIVTAVRDRHDGLRRNPWNEVECGHHYARSMSSWALLLAMSGVQADMVNNELHFNPIMDASTSEDNFQTFWSTGTAWGTFLQTETSDGNVKSEINVLGGTANEINFFVNGVCLTH